MPLIGACCELSWCEPIEARVRSIGVVVDPPFFDDPSRLAEVREHVLVEALVPQAAVEALHKAILHRKMGKQPRYSASRSAPFQLREFRCCRPH